MTAKEWLIWGAFFFAFGNVNGWLNVYFYKKRQRRREMKFVKRVQSQQQGSTVTFITIDSADKESLDKIERQLRDELP